MTDPRFQNAPRPVTPPERPQLIGRALPAFLARDRLVAQQRDDLAQLRGVDAVRLQVPDECVEPADEVIERVAPVGLVGR